MGPPNITRRLFKKELILLYALAGIGMLGHSVFRPILPIFTRHLGASGLEIGLLTSGFMLARAFISLGSGRIIDRGSSGRPLIRIGIGVAAILIFGFYFVNNYLGVLLIRIGQGVCSGLIWPSAQILVGEFSERDIRARALSVYQIVGRVGQILSRGFLALVLLIGTSYGFTEMGRFRLTFLIGGLIIGLGFIQAMNIKEKPRVEIKEVKRIHFHPIFILAFIIGGLLAMQSITILYFNEQFLLRPFNIVLLLLIVDIALMVTTYLISYLADQVGIQMAMLVIIIPCAGAAILLPFTKLLVTFVILWFIIRAAVMGFIPVARSYATGVKTAVGSNIGLLNMATNLGAVVGPIIGGVLYDRMDGGFKISGYGVLAIAFIPYLLMKIVNRKEKKSQI